MNRPLTHSFPFVVAAGLARIHIFIFSNSPVLFSAPVVSVLYTPDVLL